MRSTFGQKMLIANTVQVPPTYTVIIASGLAWVIAFVWGIKNPEMRLKAFILQLALNTQIGIVTALSYLWGIGASADARNVTYLTRDGIAVLDLGRLNSYYHISESGVWIYAITFLLTILGILFCWPKLESPNKAQMATPRKPSD